MVERWTVPPEPNSGAPGERIIVQSSTDMASTSADRTRLLIRAAFLLLAIIYLAQCFSPLRLVNDGVDYLLQASSALDGHGFLLHGTRSMRPPGYPALIFLLSKIGLGTSWAIVGMNCVFLGLGVWAGYFVLRESFGFSSYTAQLISLGTLLSFVMIRNVTYSLSDICFFGASVPCLLGMLRAERETTSRRLIQIVLLTPVIAFCIELRTIGLFLIPAWCWAALGGIEGARRFYPVIRRYRVVVGLLLTIFGAACIPVVLHSRYVQFNLPTFLRRGIYRSLIANIGYHTSEWGEMSLNVPISKVPVSLHPVWQMVGGLAIFVAAVGVWSRRRSVDSGLVYVLGSAAVIFAYPWLDSRLWLPLLPFLMASALTGLKTLASGNILRQMLRLYCAVFCLLGIVALTFTTRLTFAGPHFADIYGDGHFRATYKFAFEGEVPPNGAAIDPDGLYLLRRYEWRARQIPQ